MAPGTAFAGYNMAPGTFVVSSQTSGPHVLAALVDVSRHPPLSTETVFPPISDDVPPRRFDTSPVYPPPDQQASPDEPDFAEGETDSGDASGVKANLMDRSMIVNLRHQIIWLFFHTVPSLRTIPRILT